MKVNRIAHALAETDLYLSVKLNSKTEYNKFKDEIIKSAMFQKLNNTSASDFIKSTYKKIYKKNDNELGLRFSNNTQKEEFTNWFLKNYENISELHTQGTPIIISEKGFFNFEDELIIFLEEKINKEDFHLSWINKDYIIWLGKPSLLKEIKYHFHIGQRQFYLTEKELKEIEKFPGIMELKIDLLKDMMKFIEIEQQNLMFCKKYIENLPPEERLLLGI